VRRPGDSVAASISHNFSKLTPNPKIIQELWSSAQFSPANTQGLSEEQFGLGRSRGAALRTDHSPLTCSGICCVNRKDTDSPAAPSTLRLPGKHKVWNHHHKD